MFLHSQYRRIQANIKTPQIVKTNYHRKYDINMNFTIKDPS